MSLEAERAAFVEQYPAAKSLGWNGSEFVPALQSYWQINACEQLNPLWQCWKRARASLPVSVPDGWKLVPIKPDIEMVEAGYEAVLGQPDRGGHARVIEQYDAMLAAAPTGKAEQAPTPEFVWVRLLEALAGDNGCPFTASTDDYREAKPALVQLIAAGLFRDDADSLDGDIWTIAAGEQSEAAARFASCADAYAVLSDVLNRVFERPDEAPSLPAAGSAVEEVEVVAYQSIDATRGGGYMAHKHQLPQSHIDDGALQEPLMTVAQHNRIVAALSAQQSAPWVPSGADYDRAIHRNPDAKAWADFFIATFPGQADKHDLMLGWFANAMMAMHDHMKAQQSAHVSVLRETLENARRAMFAVLNQEPRMRAVAKRVLNAEIELIDRALLNGGEA